MSLFNWRRAAVVATALTVGSAALAADTVKIGMKDKRGRVTFVGQISETLVQRAMSTIASAQVIDERPPEQRRTDLSGRLCDLHH